MLYTIYKTTHAASGKIYVGMHKTKNPNDKYLGSGTIIGHAIKKHGQAAFSKEVLFVFDNHAEMVAKEIEVVDVEFVTRDDNYNIRPGGDGGWVDTSSDTQRARAIKSNIRQAELAAADPHFRDALKAAGSRTFRRLHQEGRINYSTFSGRHHTEDTRERISSSKKGELTGSSNPQYGTTAVWKPEEGTKRVPRAEFEAWVAQGWSKGLHPDHHVIALRNLSNGCPAGTRWMTKDGVFKKAAKEEVVALQTQGWVPGYPTRVLSAEGRLRLQASSRNLLQGKPSLTKGWRWGHNAALGIERLFPPEAQLPEGWLPGMPPKAWVCRPVESAKQIKLSELAAFLQNG